MDELDADRIYAALVHELRQPLDVIRTSVYYLANAPGASAEKIAEHLQRIEHQVVVAERAIEAISGFASRSQPTLVAVPLERCLTEALASNPLPAAVAVSVDVPDSLPAVLVDVAQLQIALGNLLRNAAEAMHGGGRLSIVARRDGERVSVEVADTGEGIPPENLERVTEPLFTTKPGGLGLGLALTRAVLERHGSALRVTSEPGAGATFGFSLRAAPE